MFRVKSALVILLAASSVSACSLINPTQSLTVNTHTPGADVYLALSGDTSQNVDVVGIIDTRIASGPIETDFDYIGSTPLIYSFSTTGYQNQFHIPGQVNAYETSRWHSGTLRVEHQNGSVEYRNFRINNGDIAFNFNDTAPKNGD